MTLFKWSIIIALAGFTIWFFFSRNEQPPPFQVSEDVTRAEVSWPDTKQTQPLELRPTPTMEKANPPTEDRKIPVPHASVPVAYSPTEHHQTITSTTTIETAPLDPNSLVRDSLGNLAKINQRTAMSACVQRKMHLPTMRELAQLAQSRGAKGILEVNNVKEGVNPEDLPGEHSLDGTEDNTYYLVDVVNPDKKRDTFYYNPRGYVAPADESGNQLFISSSRGPNGLENEFGLNGKNGVLGGEGRKYFEGTPGTALGFALCLKNK